MIPLTIELSIMSSRAVHLAGGNKRLLGFRQRRSDAMTLPQIVDLREKVPFGTDWPD